MYIASTLRKNGHEVNVYNQDVHHYPDEHLTQFLDNNEYDVVCLSFIAGYYQYRKAIAISQAINRSKRRPFFVIGGHGPTPEPEFFMRKTGCDVIVMGEGESTIIELLNSGLTGRFDDIKGIAWNDNGKCVVNERRPLICDIDSIPLPAHDLFPMWYYRLMRQPNCDTTDFCFPMLTGRGCTFNCNFCYRMDEGFRPRSNEAIIEEAQLLKKDYGITYISFNDELLMVSKERVMSLCEDFIKYNLGVKWYCNGRLNYATPEVLRLMRAAGCVFINYGIESYDDTALKNMNKALTTKRIKEGIEATLEAGISPGFNIIFGNIGEDLNVLQKDIDFLLKYDDGAQLRTIRPVTPYPGSPLYYLALEKGLLKDCEDFYENKHLNSDLLAVNFTDLTEDEFHAGLNRANRILVENYFEKKKQSYTEQMNVLYAKNNLGFRGFRQT